MAITVNYVKKIEYTLGEFNTVETYKNILTDTQLEQLPSVIEKDFVIVDAYCKIDSLNGTKDNLEIKLCIYKDEGKQVVIASKSYSFVPDLYSVDNFVKQGYEYLKLLPEYANAVDC